MDLDFPLEMKKTVSGVWGFVLDLQWFLFWINSGSPEKT